jgi:membrane dipeptidase
MKMSDEAIREKALKICQHNLILDSHIDWPASNLSFPQDISGMTDRGDFDFVRAGKGGLNAVLSVMYVSSGYDVDKGRATVETMFKLIDHYTGTYPDKCAPAPTPGDVIKNFENNLISLPVCLENGSPVGDDLEYLKYLKGKGVVYITLNHDRANQISDSNFDADRRWNGLSPFGQQVISEMNRLGIMIDISHSTDSTVFQVLRLSSAPIAATHSSCRYFTPGFERNLSDTLIKAIAAKNGVIMVNFSAMFIDSVCLRNTNDILDTLYRKGLPYDSKEGSELIQEFARTHRLLSDSKTLVDHIDHIIKVAGIDHVGLGSDFDGIGPSKPEDVPDVSAYPVIVAELLKRGYKEAEIRKILSGNFLRVWNEVIDKAESTSVGDM